MNLFKKSYPEWVDDKESYDKFISYINKNQRLLNIASVNRELGVFYIRSDDQNIQKIQISFYKPFKSYINDPDSLVQFFMNYVKDLTIAIINEIQSVEEDTFDSVKNKLYFILYSIDTFKNAEELEDLIHIKVLDHYVGILTKDVVTAYTPIFKKDLAKYGKDEQDIINIALDNTRAFFTKDKFKRLESFGNALVVEGGDSLLPPSIILFPDIINNLSGKKGVFIATPLSNILAIFPLDSLDEMPVLQEFQQYIVESLANATERQIDMAFNYYSNNQLYKGLIVQGNSGEIMVAFPAGVLL